MHPCYCELADSPNKFMTQNKSSGNKFVKTKINKKKITRLNILTLTGSFGGLFRTIRAESYNLKNKLLKIINIRQKDFKRIIWHMTSTKLKLAYAQYSEISFRKGKYKSNSTCLVLDKPL